MGFFRRRCAPPSPPNQRPSEGIAGPSFAEYIRSQLVEERARKSSLEQRGAGVIATAGTLSTFLFGIASFSKASNTAFKLTPGDEAAVVAAVVLMLAAAVLGLFVNRIRKYGEVDDAFLMDLTTDDEAHWRRRDVTEAQRQIARTDAKTLKTARGLNNTKAKLLQWALRAEIVAIFALAASVSLVLTGH